ncbi:hypothetical protein BC827DRAFT_1229789, partial [Russula dissimulans]
LRVNRGHDGVLYAPLIIKDKSILGTIMWTSTLPGKLNRIESSRRQTRTLTHNGHNVVWV